MGNLPGKYRNYSKLGSNRLYSMGILLIAYFLIIPQCNTTMPLQFFFPYQLNKPDKKFILNQKLAEVSGLSFISETEIALIQDELGSISIFNLEKGSITRKVSFGKKGDYEDLKIVGDTAYILRSDGVMFKFQYKSGDNPGISEIKLDAGLTAKNNTEGLCYDDQKKIFLVACKGSPELKKSKEDYKNKKAIYSFDPATGLLSDTPYVLIDINEVTRISKGTYSNAIKKLISFYNRTGIINDFEPSGISIQPHTRDLYVISSVGKVLVVINPRGRISAVMKLPPSVFKQPEGIAFDTSGNLYVSNEGRNGSGNVLKFDLEKNKHRNYAHR